MARGPEGQRSRLPKFQRAKASKWKKQQSEEARKKHQSNKAGKQQMKWMPAIDKAFDTALLICCSADLLF
ncbi:MAG TPA: hypothetical protein ENK11_00515 [Phycisphaerales bacterium]|nr:hypothetical protein [Phycisphaerales bacterium]